MTLQLPTKSLASLAAIALFVVACGGGGGGSSGGSSAPTPWAGTRQLGEAGAYTEGYSVATDTSGNVYVAGYTDGDLESNTRTGTDSAFVLKYNSSGVRQYTRQLSVTGRYTNGYAVATDTSGNVYVAGETDAGLDGNTVTGTTDFFVTKYNLSGVKLYTRQLGATGSYTTGFSVAIDALGNVYVAGTTNGNLDGNTLTGSHDPFVTKYDSSGTKLYTRQLGATGKNTYGYSVATDAAGNVYVAGATDGGLDGNALTGTLDFFVTKYDGSGVKQYTRQLGVTGGSTVGNSVTTDASGNAYVAGHTTGGLDGNTLTGSRDFFVTKYDGSGTKQYTVQLGVTGETTTGHSVTTDNAGNIYVAGQTTGGLDGNTLMSVTDFFVTKFDSSGTKQYTRQLGAEAGSASYGYSAATDANGSIFVAGYTTGGLDGNTLTGIRDFFVTKYDSGGVKQ